MTFGTDTSERSEFLRGKNIAIKAISKTELLEELCKREGVVIADCGKGKILLVRE